MSKSNKKNKKKSVSAIVVIDQTLDEKYHLVMNDINKFQLRLNNADRIAKKKVRKKMKKNPNYFNTCTERMKARKEVIHEMEGDNILDRIENIFKELCPVVIIIARLVASLIITILNFTPIKTHISPEMMKKLDALYKYAMNMK